MHGKRAQAENAQVRLLCDTCPCYLSSATCHASFDSTCVRFCLCCFVCVPLCLLRGCRERRAKDKALPKAERRRVRLARKERRQMRRRLVTALTSGHLPSTLLGSSPAPPVKPTRPASASGVPSLKRQRGQQPVPSQPTASKKARSSPTPSKLVSVTSPSDHLAHAWVCVVAPNGKPFYFNPHTKVGQFAPPASETVVDCRRMGQV